MTQIPPELISSLSNVLNADRVRTLTDLTLLCSGI